MCRGLYDKLHKEEDKQITKLWELLQGQEKKEVAINSLKAAVIAIMNLPIDKSFLAESTLLTKLNAWLKDAHKKFYILYLNKISHRKHKVFMDPYSHVPKIDPNSTRLAEKSREKRFKQHAGKEKAKLTDLLINVKQVQERQVESQRQKQAEQEMQNCSFRPQIFGFGPKTKRGSSRDKCVSLYNLAKSAKKTV